MATRTWTNNAAPYLEASTLAAMEVDIAAGGKPLTGPGIDLTGVAVSTAAVQTFLNACSDGDTVIVPTGAVINLGGTVSLGKRITLTGSGELRWTAGISASIALYLGADGIVLDGVRLVNAGVTPAQTGNKQYGIYIEGNRVKVLGSSLQGFQQAITVSAFGEWHDFVIANNTVFDVPGSGDGATNTTGNNGEDRGDGIVSWGAAGVITGNRVTAAAGADARIGIHVEGLANLESTVYAHSSSMVTITGNVVTGQFRRSIVSESVRMVTITGNSVADATWWGIAIIGTTGCTVSGNAIKWTRTGADNQGAAWSPRRAAIMIYGSGLSTVVSGNTLQVESGAVLQFGISVQTDGTGTIDDLLIQGNNLVDRTQALGSGIYIDGAANAVVRPRVLENTISGYKNFGIYLYAAADFEASRNRLSGPTGVLVHGIHAEASNTSARVDGNSIFSASTAIYCYQRNSLLSVSGNLIYNATTGIDVFGSGGGVINSNVFAAVTTKTTNTGTAVLIGNN